MTPDSSAPTQPCGICTAIEQIRAGKFRDLVAKLKTSYVILGDQQFYRGYCILFAKTHATELYLMPADSARTLFDEMRLTAEAIATVVKPWKMNYECLCNSVPHVHWHLFPRQVTRACQSPLRSPTLAVPPPGSTLPDAAIATRRTIRTR